MKILVTGGSGYLGTYLKQELRNRGNRVFSLSRSSSPHIDDLVCNLTDMSEIDDICNKLSEEKITVAVRMLFTRRKINFPFEAADIGSFSDWR